jgi:hypothetical protein
METRRCLRGIGEIMESVWRNLTGLKDQKVLAHIFIIDVIFSLALTLLVTEERY